MMKEQLGQRKGCEGKGSSSKIDNHDGGNCDTGGISGIGKAVKERDAPMEKTLMMMATMRPWWQLWHRKSREGKRV